MPEAMAAEEPGDAWCAQRGLLEPQTCSDVAKHCNDTKQAAKVVQVSPRHVPGLCRENSNAPLCVQRWPASPIGFSVSGPHQ